MILDEFAQPKINEPIRKAAFKYFRTGGGREEGPAASDLEEKLEKLGWTQLGNGEYSSVYANPTKKSYVLKITNKYDAGYEQYVRLIKKNPNRHFPKISDMKKLRVGRYNYYVYLIEKLKSIPYTKASWLIDDLTLVIDNFESSSTRSLEQIFGDSKDIPKILAKNPDLVNALRIIARGIRVGLDVHEKNIMQRKDGTIVITDPYA